MSLSKILLKETFNIRNKNPYIYDDSKVVKMIERAIEPSSFICTYVASAIKMIEGDNIKIYGFSSEENPESQFFFDEESSEEGHHFAVMDDRYIIDPWIYDNYKDYKTKETFNRSVFDLKNKKDEKIIEMIYGDKSKWTDITEHVDKFENIFPTTYKSLLKHFKK